MTRLSSRTSPRISVVAPVHNEVESLERLVLEIATVLDPLDGGYEILLVDDGSDDGSSELIEVLGRRHETVRPLRRQTRGGQSAAVLAGIRAARGVIVVTIDSDLQNDPADIPRLLDLLEVYDLVGGIRAQRRDRWHRRAASRVANAIRRLVLGDSFTDVGCSLKAYRASYLRDLPAFDGLHRFLPVLVERRGAKVKEVPVRHRPRPFGASKYGVGRRAARGFVDLLAVRWLESRSIDSSLAHEIQLGARHPRTMPAIDHEPLDRDRTAGIDAQTAARSSASGPMALLDDQGFLRK